MKIHITNLQFFAHHGLYPIEKEQGGMFIVDCEVEMDTPKILVENMNQTINYEEVYNSIKTRMATPTQLLETLCQLIVQDILNTQPLAKKISISIKKMQPPIKDFVGQLGVSLTVNREQLIMNNE